MTIKITMQSDSRAVLVFCVTRLRRCEPGYVVTHHIPYNVIKWFITPLCFCFLPPREAAQGGGSENGSDGALDLVAYVEFQASQLSHR